MSSPRRRSEPGEDREPSQDRKDRRKRESSRGRRHQEVTKDSLTSPPSSGDNLSQLLNPSLLEPLFTLFCLQTNQANLLHTSASLRVASHLWRHLTKEDEVEALRQAAILDIAAFVKDHAHLGKAELAAGVGRRVEDFAKAIEML